MFIMTKSDRLNNKNYLFSHIKIASHSSMEKGGGHQVPPFVKNLLETSNCQERKSQFLSTVLSLVGLCAPVLHIQQHTGSTNWT